MILFGFPERAVGGADDNDRNKEGQYIRYRHGVKYTVKSEESGKKQCKSYTKDHFPDHGKECRNGCFSKSL